LYPIDYQQKNRYRIPLGTLIIRGSLDHAQVGPLNIIKGFSVLLLEPFFIICIQFAYFILS
jgi:hypothetical protein